ncbi:MAG: tRNA lysidine(34) synthetase TilS [Gemmatimonadaceae bacterium]|nr:tRNA lysidine(34) synthetase TilS [Gemmatimonadaceae bacterium]
MMHAFARWAPDRLAAVATFDHGTGGYATDAAAHVAAAARRLGLTVVRERARQPAHSEAAWREARWRFLRRVARAFGARVATAHTRDDQVETIVMRLLRGSGPRGLASLAAPSDIVRPWLSVSRAEVAGWAAAESIDFLEDPMNASLGFQRGRVRHDLLPAFERTRSGFASTMIALGERAAAWRRDVEAYVESLDVSPVRAGIVRVDVDAFDATTDAGRAVLWPACFARIDVVLDARGTRELVRFSTSRRRGAYVVVAGGAVAMRVGVGAHEQFELRRPPPTPTGEWSWAGVAGHVPSRLGGWRFHRLSPTDARAASTDPRVFGLPVGADVTLRNWRSGDRIQTAGAPAGRRVTRYFSDAHVPALDRSGWPVVLVGDALLCVPGLCRSLAAPHRPGWPDSIWYRCEREPD